MSVYKKQIAVLHIKGLNQTESPFFVILCVLCFQKQSFFTLILLYKLRRIVNKYAFFEQFKMTIGRTVNPFFGHLA